ncbi:MAG TPA: hypothetical protein VGM41_03155 [Chitinophagaceae bacterium]|jgi:hypothetical protein
MNASIKNILVITDFTSDRRTVIRKAASGIVNTEGMVVHLLYVVKTWNPFSRTELRPPFRGLLKGDIETYVRIITMLSEWKNDIEEVCPGSEVVIHIRKSFRVIPGILRSAKRINPDIAIIAKDPDNPFLSFMNSFSPGLLARKLPCRAIIIGAGLRQHTFRPLRSLQFPLLHNEN